MRVSNSDRETVLVIGATGRHGGTGVRVVERMQAAGRVVRALVRSDDERAKRLRESGVHTLVGDLHDRPTLPPRSPEPIRCISRIRWRSALWTRWRMWPR